MTKYVVNVISTWLMVTFNFYWKAYFEYIHHLPTGHIVITFRQHWKCAQFFTHWVHQSHMAGHIQNVLRMYPLGILRSHNRVYLECTQHLITGHIEVTCCLCSQCVHNVPSGYLGPCPQWQEVGIRRRRGTNIQWRDERRSRRWDVDGRTRRRVGTSQFNSYRLRRRRS